MRFIFLVVLKFIFLGLLFVLFFMRMMGILYLYFFCIMDIYWWIFIREFYEFMLKIIVVLWDFLYSCGSEFVVLNCFDVLIIWSRIDLFLSWRCLLYFLYVMVVGNWFWNGRLGLINLVVMFVFFIFWFLIIIILNL